MLNIGGLKQSASMARLENAISKDDFLFICEMENKKEISPAENKKLHSISVRVNNWYFN